MQPARKDDDEVAAPATEGPRMLFQRFLQRLTGAVAPPADDAAHTGPLLPPGRRTGRGTQSLAPYLDNHRNTRPGSLE